MRQRKLERLDPPGQFAGEHTENLARGREAITFVTRLARRARASDDPAKVFVDALPELAEIVDEGNATARKLGLKDCVAEPFTPGAAEPAPA